MDKNIVKELVAEEITPEDAARVLQKSFTDRINSCKDEIAKVLDRYNCDLLPEVTIIGNQIKSSFRIVPRQQ
jgi:hypothetical protein